MTSCEACAGESHSKRWPNKVSTCEDCFVDNMVVDYKFSTAQCDCHDVGHDRTKLKPLGELSKMFRRDRERKEDDESDKTVL